jgi:CheY-like chemotaxis protein
MEPTAAAVVGSLPIRALVVDDYRDAAEALARLLETMGCRADFVTDPKTAMAAATAMDAQIVFIDIGMPAINGFELAEMFRTRYGQAIRLVAVTAYGGTAIHLKCRDAGFDCHVLKAVATGAFRQTLDGFFLAGRF